MAEARQGRCGFGPNAEVDQMSISRTGVVLELRVQSTDGAGDLEVELHVRMYFTEPEHEPRVLLSALLAAKRDYPMGKEDQNQHVRIAERRLDRHYGIGM